MTGEASGTAYEIGAPRPEWMARVAAFDARGHEWFERFSPPPGTTKRSAVLMLFAPSVDGRAGESVVLTERAHTLRSHPGQVSFPGGSIDATDDGPVGAALRETEEEVGIPPATVDVVTAIPELYLTPSSNAVTPVLGWWPTPAEVRAVDPAEVARAELVPVAELTDPDNRFVVTHPLGYRGPGFRAGGLYIWGFTAMLLSVLLEESGLARPWDEGREELLSKDHMSPWMRD
ncbi:MAG TPA: CoA pyrophosphatase [Phycicoccus sp.]|jgi:8-oxo-dGTP pyrophosphatase MutT (NUDIX family)|nr:CoA pyrophosphatase [Phycicoccus sp.]HQH07928.1 CoA pyrophosphatase [Phycicoccus sp.]HQK31503.1 CoA pyrophosphatase [Phycicoccus sp.]HQY96292.1 CoA pyrophosphatase [Phycicoccus sp.]HRA44378.1 CoA pyrophosphatase [Phycicoccus sp.]